ncbi:hypothetical protein, conserved [Eimeria necatrix]|uniref:AB hydrolase-1 domain-containing protein n=1 Tax=Eimeria necatrix TaxID=51315 RepID=U6MGJ1_9EIME|nr:hypothetical protein, conserved [Eimeria necatrix]CDJ63131.1 hypothetical protein, conserved [Eimeria necatrix]
MHTFLFPWPFSPGASPSVPVTLRLWKLVKLPSRRSQVVETGEAEAHVGAPEDTKEGSTACDYVKLPQSLTNALSIFLIKLNFQRTLACTISQSELLALCQLARARASSHGQHCGAGEAFRHQREGFKAAQENRLQSVPPQVPSARGPTAKWAPHGSPEKPPKATGPLQKAEHKRFRVDPLDVCALLASGSLNLRDLPLLADLEAAAAAAEEQHQQSRSRWGWKRLLGLRCSRGQIWKAAAAALQQQQHQQQISPSRVASHRRHRKRPNPNSAEGPPSSSSLPSPHLAAATAAAEAFSCCEAAAQRQCTSSLSPTYAQQKLTKGTLSTTRTQRVQQEEPEQQLLLPSKALAASSCRVSGISPASPSPCHFEDARADAEAAGEAAAAAVSQLGSDCLALLPHACQWPLAARASRWDFSTRAGCCSARWSLQAPNPDPLSGAGRVRVSGPSGSGALGAAETLGEGWKGAVNFRVRRSRQRSGRGRDRVGRRQRLSPLDPPYDGFALLLHPFCATPSVALPDAETVRALEVAEVAVDFLSRVKATVDCAQCNRQRPSGKQQRNTEAPCNQHQRLHYSRVGEGPEKVILIHGICMSGYFFADVIRVLFPDSENGARKGVSHHGGILGQFPPHDEDPQERWRYTFYCVDLLGYGKSAAISSTQNYSRREQAEAILRDVIVANGFTSVHLVGHSFGGLVAAELCEMLPAGFVTTLILLAPAYFESERQAMRILTASHFPAAHTVAHPYFGELMLRLGVILRPLFEPLVLRIVPRGELPQLSVADVFSIHPDALTGTIRSIVQDRIDMTFQLLRQRGQRASLFHGTADGVIPIRQARFLALRYPNIHLRALPNFVHHFPASHAQFTAHIIIQEIGRSLRNGRGLCYAPDEDPSSLLVASHSLLLPGHPSWA